MRPKTLERHVGVEIECIIPKNVRSLRTKLRMISGVAVGSDGSIKTDDCYICDCTTNYSCDHCRGHCRRVTSEGIEVRILATEDKIASKINKVVGLLKEYKAKVNSSCGLHVHLDMRTRNMENSAINLFQSLPLMKKLVKKERLGNRFCSINKQPLVDSKYTAINAKMAYMKHMTCEVRLHHGSVNATEIKMWVSLLVSLVDKQKIRPDVETYCRKKGVGKSLISQYNNINSVVTSKDVL